MEEIMKIRMLGLALISGLSLLAFTTMASAAVICNDEGDCWHSQQNYTYPPGTMLHIHPDNWRWKGHEHYAWREHEGRGYWQKGAWVGF
jgi:hypothetical protein